EMPLDRLSQDTGDDFAVGGIRRVSLEALVERHPIAIDQHTRRKVPSPRQGGRLRAQVDYEPVTATEPRVFLLQAPDGLLDVPTLAVGLADSIEPADPIETHLPP